MQKLAAESLVEMQYVVITIDIEELIVRQLRPFEAKVPGPPDAGDSQLFPQHISQPGRHSVGGNQWQVAGLPCP